MVDIQSTAAEIRRGKKRNKKPQDENIMSASAIRRAAIKGGFKGHFAPVAVKRYTSADGDFSLVLSGNWAILTIMANDRQPTTSYRHLGLHTYTHRSTFISYCKAHNSRAQRPESEARAIDMAERQYMLTQPRSVLGAL